MDTSNTIIARIAMWLSIVFVSGVVSAPQFFEDVQNIRYDYNNQREGNYVKTYKLSNNGQIISETGGSDGNPIVVGPDFRSYVRDNIITYGVTHPQLPIQQYLQPQSLPVASVPGRDMETIKNSYVGFDGIAYRAATPQREHVQQYKPALLKQVVEGSDYSYIGDDGITYRASTPHREQVQQYKPALLKQVVPTDYSYIGDDGITYWMVRPQQNNFQEYNPPTLHTTSHPPPISLSALEPVVFRSLVG